MTTSAPFRQQLAMEEILRRWEKAKVIRNKARRSLHFLCDVLLGYHDINWDVHCDLINNLQKFKGGTDNVDARGIVNYVPFVPLWEMEGPRNNLSLYPRGHLKTTIITIAHTIQWIINYPNVRILISTATGDQCKKMLMEIKSHFQFNKQFRYYFPDYVPIAKKAADFGSQEEFTVPNRTIHRKEPTVSTCSVGKVIAGSHYEVIKNSDLVDKENVKTPGQIADVISHFGYLNPLLERSEVAPYHGWVDVEGTRYDFGDLYGRLLDGATYRTVVRPRSDEDTVWPARFPVSELKRIEKEVGPYIFCTPGESPILMEDGGFKPISAVNVGDFVLGWDDTKNRAPLKVVRVLDKGELEGEVQEIKTASGAIARATEDHLWFTGRYGDHNSYAKANGKYHGLKSLQKVVDCKEWFEERQPRDPYLGGIFDGEGSLTARTTLNLTQSERENPSVCCAIRKHLTMNGFSWGEHHRDDGSVLFQLHGGFRNTMRFLRVAFPARRHEIMDRLLPNTRRFCEPDRIIGKKKLGKQKVFWLQTESGNYIAWGFGSRNSCQYRNRPIPPEGGLCDPKDIVFLPRNIISQIMPSLRLHCTIDLHGMEPARNDNDATALTVHGFDRDGRMYVMDIRHGRFTPDKVIWHIFDIHARYPLLIDFKIEKEAHARVLLPFLQREASKRQRFPCMVPIKRDTHISKQQRIRGLQPWFKAGIVRFADDLSCKTDLILEIMQFPSQSSGVHDDILDTLADAMQNQEGGVNLDVVADANFDPRQMFGMDKPRDRFLGFNMDGTEGWLYGNEGKILESPLGVL